MSLITEIPNHDGNIFDCLSTTKEIFVPAKEAEKIDYMVTIYPRNEDFTKFSFVYGLFQTKNPAFADNQINVLDIAKRLFSGSTSLTETEQSVLNNTFLKEVNKKPSLPGRK
jgi:spore coat polysaccharide biosynthesis protein SpsF (cytidylyltransferase family)